LFPIVYDIFTREQKVEIATKKAQASLNGFCEAARRLAPRYVVPYADGWRRGGFDAGWIDQINVRNNPYVAKRELEARLDGAPTRCVIMNPGDYFSEAEGFVTIDPSRLEQRGQVESPYPPLAPIEEIELRERLERHFRTAFERCFDVTKTLRRRLLFEFVGPGQFHPFQVNFEGGTLGFGTAAEWSDRMRIDERLLGEVLRSDDPLLWEELLVSWRYTLARKTDELCRPLWSGLMSYPDPAYVRLFA
jgi:hypothetical protein